MRVLKSLFGKYYFILSVVTLSTVAFIFYLSISVSTQNEGKKEVEIYFADNISLAHSKVISRFNEKYQGRIKVVPIDLPFAKFSTNERKELLTRSLRSKSDRIDVFAVDLIWVKRFAKWSLPLDKYFNEKKLSDYINYAMKSCFSDGKLFAIPFYLDISTMYYRDDLLKKEPDYLQIKQKLDSSITWEDFIELGIKIKSQKNKYYTFPAEAYEGLICSYAELVLSQSPDFFENLQDKNSEKIIRKSLELLVDLVNKYNLTSPDVVNYKEQECYKYFLQNDGMFLRGWPSFVKDYRNISHDVNKEKLIKQVPLPHFRNAKKSFTFGGWNLMISKYTPHINEVIEFLNFTSSEEAQNIMLNDGAYLPINKRIYADSNYLINGKKLSAYQKLFNYGVHRPSWKNYTKISDELSHYINSAIKNEITIDEAVNKIKLIFQSQDLN